MKMNKIESIILGAIIGISTCLSFANVTDDAENFINAIQKNAIDDAFNTIKGKKVIDFIKIMLYKNKGGNTPLHVAAGKDTSGTTVNVLIDWIEKANSGFMIPFFMLYKNNHGNTPLHVAATNNFSCKTVEFLIDKTWQYRSDFINNFDVVEKLPIDKKTKKILQDLRSKINQDGFNIISFIMLLQNNRDNTPLHVAAEKNSSGEVVKALISKMKEYLYDTTIKEIISMKNKNGNTPLALAQKYRPKSAEILVEEIKKLEHYNLPKKEDYKRLLETFNGDAAKSLQENLKAIDDDSETLDEETKVSSHQKMETSLRIEIEDEAVGGELGKNVGTIVINDVDEETKESSLQKIETNGTSMEIENKTDELFLNIKENNIKDIEDYSTKYKDDAFVLLETILHKDNDGNTPLHVAAGNDPSGMTIKALIDGIENSNLGFMIPVVMLYINNNGDTPLHVAATNNLSAKTVEFLIDKTWEYSSKFINDFDGIVASLQVNQQQRKILKDLGSEIKSKINPNSLDIISFIMLLQNNYGNTPLYLAVAYYKKAKKGSNSVVEALLNKMEEYKLYDTIKEIIFFIKNIKENTPFALAIKRSSKSKTIFVEEIKKLEHYGLLKKEDYKRLLETFNGNAAKILQENLERLSNFIETLDEKNKESSLQKMEASETEDEAVDEKLQENVGTIVIDDVDEENKESSLQKIETNGTSMEIENKADELFLNIKENKIENIKSFIKQKKAIDFIEIMLYKNEAGNTPLHVAAGKDTSSDAVKALIDGIENSKLGFMIPVFMLYINNDGDTPLHVAATKNLSGETVKFLIDKTQKYSSVFIENFDGIVASLQVNQQQGKILQDLGGKIKSKINPDSSDIISFIMLLQNNYGNTPFHMAAGKDSSGKVVKALISKMKPYEIPEIMQMKNEAGNTPLHVAAGKDTSGMTVKALIDGIENSKLGFMIPVFMLYINNDGNTPLHVAAEKDLLGEIINILIDKTWEHSSKFIENFDTIVSILKINGIDEKMQKILQDLGGKIKSKINPDSSDIISFIMLLQNNYGNTPLHMATENDPSGNIAKTLLGKIAKLSSALPSSMGKSKQELTQKQAAVAYVKKVDRL